MIASPPAVSSLAPPTPSFISGTRIEIRGDSASALLYAVDRLPASVDLDRTIVTIQEHTDGPPTIYFWAFPAALPWRNVFSITVPVDVARSASVPWGARGIWGDVQLDPTLLGVDLHAMTAALRTRPKGLALAPYSVLLQKLAGNGTIAYGVALTKLYWVCCIAECDLQTRVDPLSMVPEHWRCVG